MHEQTEGQILYEGKAHIHVASDICAQDMNWKRDLEWRVIISKLK